jgi:hypothetical protein
MNGSARQEKDYSWFNIIIFCSYIFLLVAPAGVLGWFVTNSPYISYRQTYIYIAVFFFVVSVVISVNQFVFLKNDDDVIDILKSVAIFIFVFQVFTFIHQPVLSRLPFPSEKEVISNVKVVNTKKASGRYRICDLSVTLNLPTLKSYCFDKFKGMHFEVGDQLLMELRKIYFFGYELGYEIESVSKIE